MSLFASAAAILLPILGIGFVIVIHELGHYLAAKWAGVRVHTFSVGFGPVVLRKTVGETDYVLSLLPFGGFVDMLREPHESAPGRSMAEVSPWWQACILFAGVFFNLVSSFILLLCLAWYGMPHFPPVVGGIQSQIWSSSGEYVPSPAHRLGLQDGDRIVRLNGKPIRSYESIVYAASSLTAEDPIEVAIERRGEHLVLPRPDEPPVHIVWDKQQGRGRLGVMPAETNLVALAVGPDTEAIGPRWRLVGVDDTDTSGWYGFQLDDLLLPAIGSEHRFVFAGDDATAPIVLEELWLGDPAYRFQAKLGLPVLLTQVFPGQGHEDGLRSGDVLLACEGVPMHSAGEFVGAIRRAGETPIRLDLLRVDPERPDDWMSLQITTHAVYDQRLGRLMIGVAPGTLHSGVMGGLRPGSALAEAGIANGDSLLGMEPLPAKDGEPESYALLRLPGGGTTRLAPLPEEAWSQLLAEQSPSVFLKFFGARTRPSVVGRLLGGRVLGISGSGDEALLRVVGYRLEVAEGTALVGTADERSIPLAALPAAAREVLASLAVGDWVVSADRYDAEGRRSLQIVHGNEALAPEVVTATVERGGLSLAFRREEIPYPLESWTEGFGLAAWRSADMVQQTGRILAAFFKAPEEGGVDPSKALHGPIGIFSELKARMQYSGFASLVNLVALLGLNLFLINLVPIPITDGGQLLQLGIEQVIRRPIPPRIIDLVNKIGVAFILALMLFVVGIDILRQLGAH